MGLIDSFLSLCVSVGLLVASPPLSPPAAAKIVVYRGANLIDGAGGDVRPDMAIVVDGATIKSVLPSRALAPETLKDAEVVDLNGLYVLPGLIDTHVHLMTSPNRKWAEAMLRRNIYGGITAVRDMAGDTRALGDLARAVRVGEIAGPDIYYAALMSGHAFFADERSLSTTKGAVAGAVPWMQAITDQTDLPLAVALARGTSATGLKLYAHLSGALVTRITTEAHRQGIPVWSHGIVFPATPADVVAAGTDVISHACQVAFQASDPPPTSPSPVPLPDYARLADPDNARMAALFKEMRRRNEILDATNYVYVRIEKDRTAAGKPVACPADLSARVTAQAYREGVLISAGTDEFSPPEDPYPSLYEEMTILNQKAKIPTAQVIQSATLIGAMAIGKQAEMGTVKPGKLANLLVVAKNPLDDLRNLRSVVFTVKRGVRYQRSDYRPISADEAAEDDD